MKLFGSWEFEVISASYLCRSEGDDHSLNCTLSSYVKYKGKLLQIDPSLPGLTYD